MTNAIVPATLVVQILGFGGSLSFSAAGVPPLAIGIAVGTLAVATGVALVIGVHNATSADAKVPRRSS